MVCNYKLERKGSGRYVKQTMHDVHRSSEKSKCVVCVVSPLGNVLGLIGPAVTSFRKLFASNLHGQKLW